MNASAVIVLLCLVVFAAGAQPPPQPQPQPGQPQPQPTPMPGQPQPQPQPEPSKPQQPPSESQGKSVKEFTEKLIQNIQNYDKEAMLKCITNRTKILVSSKLPFGGRYRGQEGFSTFLARCDHFMEKKKNDVSLMWADDRTGISMLNSVFSGTLKKQETVQPQQPQQPRNQQPPQPQPQPPQPQPQPQPQPSDNKAVDIRTQIGVEWYADGKICKFVVLPLNDHEILEQSRTKSELVLHQILPVVLKKDKELDVNQLKQFVADDLTVKLYNFGSQQLVPKTEFKGLQEISDAMKNLHQRGESKCMQTDIENFCSGTFKVLHSDDTRTVVLFIEGRSSQYMPKFSTVTFTLNQQGKLANVEIVRSSPLYPWQIGSGSADTQKPQPQPQPQPQPPRA